MLCPSLPRWLVLCSVVLCVGAACHGAVRPEPAPTAPPAAAAPTPPPPVAAASVPPAPPSPILPGCAAPLSTGEAADLTLGTWHATKSGSHLTLAADPNSKESKGFTLGVLGPINEDTGANMVALEKYAAFFKEHHANAVVVTGDSGETPRGIARVLGLLAKSGLPVFVVVGNSECAADYQEGVSLAQKEYPNIVNLNEYRSVAFPALTLVSLPGHHDANFLHCAKGCLYTPSTVDEVIKAAKEAKSPVVLVSHGPPKGDGSQALDYTPNAGGGNVGNPDLQRALHDGEIPFGFFSNIKEAGARATDASGSTVIPQNTVVKSLFINPGPASTDAWKMNDGKTSHGFAAVFTLSPKGASWTLFQNTAPSPAEKKRAKALEPKAE
jgi:Icc-related predicted phosphoesterase